MKVIIIFSLFHFINCAIFSQNLNFSQLDELPTLRNPAFAGFFRSDFQVKAVFRNQWSNVSRPAYNTIGLTALVKTPRVSNRQNSLSFQHTGGVLFTRGKAGDAGLVRNQIALVYSPMCEISEGVTVSMGFLVGGVFSSFDASRLRWNDEYATGQYIPNSTQQTLTSYNLKDYFDLSGGVAFSKINEDQLVNYFGGVSVFHAVRSNIAFGRDTHRLKGLLGINGGLILNFENGSGLLISGDIPRTRKPLQTLLRVMYKLPITRSDDPKQDIAISFGGGYRLKDAGFAMVKLFLAKWLTVGLAYDFTFSKLATAASIYAGPEFITNMEASIFNGNNGIPCPAF